MEKFGNLDIRNLDTEKVERWQSALLKSGNPATANRKLACLKQMMTKAVDWNMTSEDMLK